MMTIWTHCHLWEKVFVSVTQWQHKIFKKSFTFRRDLSVSLSFSSCSLISELQMNYSDVSHVQTFIFYVTYLVDLLQDQRVHSLILSFDVQLTDLISIYDDWADLSHWVTIAHSVKKVLDLTLYCLSECVIGIDVNNLAVSKEVRTLAEIFIK